VQSWPGGAFSLHTPPADYRGFTVTGGGMESESVRLAEKDETVLLSLRAPFA